MLEAEIKELTKAIQVLTETINNLILIYPQKVIEKNKIIENVFNKKNISTSAFVQKLARDKIKAGATRKEIKKMITQLGAESISELDEISLNRLKIALEALND
tara:strand:+ start:399 stop:707 length:309 start_codon:yes stop_codon:yes gene_type:complete